MRTRQFAGSLFVMLHDPGVSLKQATQVLASPNLKIGLKLGSALLILVLIAVRPSISGEPSEKY